MHLEERQNLHKSLDGYIYPFFTKLLLKMGIIEFNMIKLFLPKTVNLLFK